MNKRTIAKWRFKLMRIVPLFALFLQSNISIGSIASGGEVTGFATA
jgi:hypothetical protein